MSPSCRALQGAEYQLRLSLFDATYHHFFGRTWRSSRRAARAAPPRPARAAFNEVGCWGGGRAGWVWENAGTPPGRGGDPAGRRLELQESSRRREVFKYVKGKAAFARVQPGAALLWCWFGSVSLWKRSSESSGSLRSARRSREPFKAASPKRARALARGRSVLLLSLVCGASFSCTQADSSSNPFLILCPGCTPDTARFLRFYARFIGMGRSGSWVTSGAGRRRGSSGVPPRAACCVQSRRQRAVFLHEWEGRERDSTFLTFLLSSLTWGLNWLKAVLPSAADTRKPGCPLTGEIPLPRSGDDSRDVTFSNSYLLFPPPPVLQVKCGTG